MNRRKIRWKIRWNLFGGVVLTRHREHAREGDQPNLVFAIGSPYVDPSVRVTKEAITKHRGKVAV